MTKRTEKDDEEDGEKDDEEDGEKNNEKGEDRGGGRGGGRRQRTRMGRRMRVAKDPLKSTMEQSRVGSAPNTILSMYLVRHNSPKEGI